ncbi:MAG TPA: hypothetical protein VK137_00605, partial [Planctomycetaceae bacterium]|nr:hypothetical protein [Planctomycetaceae bacterium]
MIIVALPTTGATAEKVRFVSPPTSVQMRVELWSGDGNLVYDSNWKDGSIVDWLPSHPLSVGEYRLVMKSRNLVGEILQRETELHVDSDGMAIVEPGNANPKITVTAHDGETGQLITTSGDLSFRFGDFLNCKDAEAMRLTAGGELTVHGLIHAGGVMFPDGTLLTSASGTPADAATERKQNAVTAERGAAPQSSPIIRGAPPVAPAARPAPRPNFVPGYQFVMDELGVTIGTTNTQYKLEVAGTINTGKEYYIGGTRILHNYPVVNQNTFVGVNAGSLTNNGSRNVGNGYAALSAAAGTDNTAIGAYSLTNNGGNWNTAVGSYALNTNTGGNYNTAVGYFALQATFPNGSQHGSSNTAVGVNAMANNTTGNFNVALGQNAGFDMTTGNSNIALGYGAGTNLTNGNDNIDIGNSGVAAEGGTIRIGTSGTHTRAFIAGISGVTLGPSTSVVIDSNGQLGSIASSRR